MNIYEDQYVWSEKYRPKTVDDLILPEIEKEKLNSWLSDGQIPNIGVWGNIPGTGKSSIMNVIMSELGVEILWINGSKDNGIDVMRNEIGGFVKGKSTIGKHKLIALDESDYLTDAAQSSLRSDLENYSKNVRFMFTGNYPDKIMEPLRNRLQNFDLDKIYSSNKKELGIQIFNRLTSVLENEGLEYEKSDVLKVISSLYPSTRNMLNFIQANTTSGKLSFDNITKPDEVFEALVHAIKSRKFKEVKSCVNDVLVPENFYTYLYKHLDEIFQPQSQPMVILEMADYQEYSIKAKNKLIPLLALSVKIMSDSDVEFK